VANTWYLNPATGNDSNPGNSASRAWRTAARLNTALADGTILGNSAHPWRNNDGTFPANPLDGLTFCTGHKFGLLISNGDTVLIDTSNAPLYLSAPLVIGDNLAGLLITSASADRADIRAYKPVFGWQRTAGYNNIFDTPDTEQYVVLWENLRWLNHPVGANFGAVAAQLDSIAGSFWTDGIRLYVHPFGDTDPRTDGKSYTRSQLFSGAGDSAINITGNDIMLSRLNISGTCLVDSSVNDSPPSTIHYCIQTVCNNNRIFDCFLSYGSKHVFGSLRGISNRGIFVDSVVAEQGSPYTVGGGQTIFVAYSDTAAGTTSMTAYFKSCSCVNNEGLIGGISGIVDFLDPVFITHNSSTGIQWTNIFLDSCNFSGLVISQTNDNILDGLIITDCTFGAAALVRSSINRGIVDATSVGCNIASPGISIKNSIFRPIQPPASASGYSVVSGIYSVTNCVVDLRNSPAVTPGAMFFRSGASTFVFSNNIFITKSGVLFMPINLFFSTDTLVIDNNIYQLDATTNLSKNYDDGNTTSTRTFDAWQKLGFDIHSLLADPLLDSLYLPRVGSPVGQVAAGEFLLVRRTRRPFLRNRH